jgi:predicted GNAT family acetyltransferase
VRFLDPEFAAVAAMREVTAENVSSLASAISDGAEILAITPEPILATAEIKVIHTKPLLQMVARNLTTVRSNSVVSVLTQADLPQMLELVDLARPGPLSPRSFELGGFRGIFDGETLVALAGERLQLDGFTEIATVCTHPQHRGLNYGKVVVSAIAHAILERGHTPFLGVNADNIPAVRLYEHLGFTYTRTLYLNTIRRLAPVNQAETAVTT